MISRRFLLQLMTLPVLAQNQEPTFRVDVRLVRVLATVKNNSGELIGGLGNGDFEVLDNGVPQEVTVFERQTAQPLSIALLIDTSASTAIDLKYEIESVQKFLRAVIREGNSDDSASLYAFNWETIELTGFTRSIGHLEGSLRNLKTGGGTSLYDAMIFAADAIDEREGRHVIVIVTDGGDTTSTRTFHQALEAVQRADSVVYPILVMPITNEAGRNIGGENALTQFAQGTGGRVFTPGERTALDQAFSEILRELRTQYLLGFYPRNVPATKDPFHRLQIRLKNRPELRVTARSGYYEESEAPARGWRPVR
ncbi:MAG TPA: VWA domain-containing protein [Bryobacteraceae bacterium]|nr:VWA domain-containing protein [Bryobacteraceae bacterium]